jgi:hypothetical protein
MTRSFGILSAFLVACPLGLYGVGVAAADPMQPGGNGTCNFSVDPPKVVNVSGTQMVTSSGHIGACTLHGTNEVTVCLSMQGGDTNGLCEWADTPNTAIVYAPYKPGATYIVQGKGCTHTMQGSDSPATPAMVCKDIPATRATL